MHGPLYFIIFQSGNSTRRGYSMMEIPITFQSDEKGYFDRECPNENCLYSFKINMNDQKEKVTNEEVHCPMCGHIDTSDKWWTQKQLEGMQDIAANYAMSLITGKLDKAFGELAKSTRRNKYVKITYKPGRRISFENNPIGQCEEWETDIICEKCGTRYSVIGPTYFLINLNGQMLYFCQKMKSGIWIQRV